MDKVIIKNRSYYIGSRTTLDYYFLDKMKDEINNYEYMLYVVAGGLRINLELCKWYQFIKKFRIRKILNIRKLASLISFSQLTEICKLVYKADGLDIKEGEEIKKKLKAKLISTE